MIEEIVKKWLREVNAPYSFVGDIDDITDVTLDGGFDLEELSMRIYNLGTQDAIEKVDKLKNPFASMNMDNARINAANEWEQIRSMFLTSLKTSLTEQEK